MKITNGFDIRRFPQKTPLQRFDWSPNVPPIEVLSLWSRLQVCGICSCKEVYSEVVKAQSNYKKSYLW